MYEAKNVNSDVVTKQIDILSVFIFKLVYQRTNIATITDIDNYFSIVHLSSLPHDQCERISYAISDQECLWVLNAMTHNKSPGPRWLLSWILQIILGWFKTFTVGLQKLFTCYWSFFNSQREGIIAMLPKPKKDRLVLPSNYYRSITLLNTHS